MGLTKGNKDHEDQDRENKEQPGLHRPPGQLHVVTSPGHGVFSPYRPRFGVLTGSSSGLFRAIWVVLLVTVAGFVVKLFEVI